MNKKLILMLISFNNLIFYSSSTALAQIIPDASLGSEISIVNIQKIDNQAVINITGGSVRDKALFHSFSDFNLATGEQAFINSLNGINVILTRVTGNSASILDGTLGIIGTGNLYFLNSNGIIFGSNFNLNLNGSFIATTAESIIFKDYEFTSQEPKMVPNIAINYPTGLKFNNSTSEIRVNNDSFSVFASSSQLTPFFFTEPIPKGLSVNPGFSLSLIGGNVTFDGGIVNSFANNVNIAAINTGIVFINDINQNPIFNYNNISKFNNLSFINSSFILNTGFNFGSTNLVGSNISILDGSTILFTNVGSSQTPGINLFAENDITISGNENIQIPSSELRPIFGILSTALSDSVGGDINLRSKNLVVDKAGSILSSTFNSGSSGNINIKAFNQISLTDSAVFPSVGSIFGNISYSSGDSGNINIEGQKLSLRDGSPIVTFALASGKGGDINVNVKDIQLTGFNPKTALQSSISALTSGSGKSGNININSDSLQLIDSGRLDSATFGIGNAGDVNVNSKNLLITGTFSAQFNGKSFVGSSGNKLDPITQFFIPGFISNLRGNSGKVNINSDIIAVTNGGEITIRNDGIGDSGELKITSNYLFLDDGLISASTQSGNGGNTQINTEVLLLKSSRIDSSARLSGNGGNTTIVAKAIAGDYQSAITANADQGFGGNINIDTLALVFPLSNITATSQRGVDFDGSINIKSVEFTRIDQATKQPVILDRSLPEICNSSINERNFLISAADIPEDIDNLRESDSPLSKVPYSVDNKTGKKILDIGIQGWIERPDGKAETIAFNNLAFGGSYLVNACRELSNNAAKK